VVDLKNIPERIKSRIIRDFPDLMRYLIWMTANSLCIIGIISIIDVVFSWFDLKFRILDRDFSTQTSRLITIFSCILVCISIYTESAIRRSPTTISKTFISPLIIILSVAVFIYYIGQTISNGPIEQKLFDALSFLALGGSMMRLTGNPFQHDED
jgi:hypothetical protein